LRSFRVAVKVVLHLLASCGVERVVDVGMQVLFLDRRGRYG
jgi:hypothetical protein